jgi:hypothetical protein
MLLEILGVLALTVVLLGLILGALDSNVPNPGKTIDHDIACPCFDCQPTRGRQKY